MVNSRFVLLSVLAVLGCAAPNEKTADKLQTALPFQLQIAMPKPDAAERLQWDRMEKMNPNEARDFIKHRQAAIDRLLEPSIDPYRGDDAFPDICKQKNLPKTTSDDSPRELSMSMAFYSSHSYVLGLCADPKRLLKTQYQVLHCPSSSEVFVLKYFYGAAEPWRTEALAKCS